MQILFLILMFVLGSVFGSFLCCQARRLHLREQTTGKGNAEDVLFETICDRRGATRATEPRNDGREGARREKNISASRHGPRKPLASLPSRSVCLHCRHQLKWYDNIPIISWLALGGKCRHCHQKIGLAEFLSELGLGLSFLGLSCHFLYSSQAFAADILANFPTVSIMGWLIFIMMLLLTLSLGFLAIYDGLYGELPNFCLTISAICAIIIVILQTGNSFLVAGFFNGTPASTEITPEIIISSAPVQTLLMSIASAILFGGIYLVLYKVSRGKWVGDGDWLLAGIIGLALGHPFLSLIALFIANLSACLVMAPTIKGKKNHQIYFGPFLVFAFVVVSAFSNFFISVLP